MSGPLDGRPAQSCPAWLSATRRPCGHGRLPGLRRALCSPPGSWPRLGQTAAKTRAEDRGRVGLQAGQHQAHPGVARDAHVLAGQPVGLGLHAELVLGVVGRNVDDRHQRGMAFIAIGDQAAGVLEDLGLGPEQGPRRHALGQDPGHVRGQARVARVLPIGVPARVLLQAQGHHQVLARLEAVGLGHQAGLHVGVAAGGEDGGRGRAADARAEEKLRWRMVAPFTSGRVPDPIQNRPGCACRTGWERACKPSFST